MARNVANCVRTSGAPYRMRSRAASREGLSPTLRVSQMVSPPPIRNEVMALLVNTPAGPMRMPTTKSTFRLAAMTSLVALTPT